MWSTNLKVEKGNVVKTTEFGEGREKVGKTEVKIVRKWEEKRVNGV